MIYLINRFDQNNIGDLAIFYATNKLLNNLNLYYEILNERNYLNFKINKSDILLLCGGGSLGIYEGKAMDFFINFINEHRLNKIIFLPNSFIPCEITKINNYFKITDINAEIFARDPVSFNYYKNEFKNSNIHLCPDIVFYLDKINLNIKPKYKCGFFCRNDCEITELSNKLKTTFKLESRFYKKYVEYKKNNDEILKAMFDLMYRISQYKYIITDTLHCSIFAYLLNKKCYYIDNKYGKLSNTWNQYSSKNIIPYNSLNNMSEKIEYENIKFDFSNLINVLINKKEG